MARAPTLSLLEAEARKRADVESFDARHPSSDVRRYLNQGGTELRDIIIDVRGRSHFRKFPGHTIVTDGVNTRFALPTDFLRLISARVAGSGGYTLSNFTTEEEPELRDPGLSGCSSPTHYDYQPGYLEILPLPTAGVTIVVDYIPLYTDLVNDDDTLSEAFNGWEEYVIVFAARCIAVKDELWELKRALDAELARLTARIQKLAAGRDAFRAERVKDVRGSGPRGRSARSRRWG